MSKTATPKSFASLCASDLDTETCTRSPLSSALVATSSRSSNDEKKRGYPIFPVRAEIVVTPCRTSSVAVSTDGAVGPGEAATTSWVVPSIGVGIEDVEKSINRGVWRICLAEEREREERERAGAEATRAAITSSMSSREAERISDSCSQKSEGVRPWCIPCGQSRRGWKEIERCGRTLDQAS